MFTGITVPVLLIGFNRPMTTEIVFSHIRQAKPAKLYVAIDGPRPNKENDFKLIEKVKSIVQNVDWPCETLYRFNPHNFGAEITVSSAINWVFEKEEYAIILEDDIVAPISFFRFAEEMLIRYKDEEKIGTITGSNFTPIPVPDDTDYFFAKYGHSWGWATWKRAWKDYNLKVEIPEEHLCKEFLKTICNSDAEVRYYQKKFKEIKSNGIGKSTWDNIGLYFHRINNRLSIIPRVNLTSNIGVFGLHSFGVNEHHFRSVDEEFIVRKHPKEVICFTTYDENHFKTYINKRKCIIHRIWNKAYKIISRIINK